MTEPEKKVRHLVVCGRCDGDGTIPDFTRPRGPFFLGKTCPLCKGKGWVDKPPNTPDSKEKMNEPDQGTQDHVARGYPTR